MLTQKVGKKVFVEVDVQLGCGTCVTASWLEAVPLEVAQIATSRLSTFVNSLFSFITLPYFDSADIEMVAPFLYFFKR